MVILMRVKNDSFSSAQAQSYLTGLQAASVLPLTFVPFNNDSFSYAQAQSYLSSLQSASPLPVTFVGVHVRRTDYPGWLETQFGAHTPVDDKYFRSAMAQVRAATPQERAVRFVVLSDDVAWCRERLEGAKDVVFPHKEKEKVGEEQNNEKKNEEEREEKATTNFVPGKEKTPMEKTEAERHRVAREERWRRKMNANEKNEKKKKKEKVIMDNEPDRVVEDFILLTQMNRTVYDYGSFGFWSAVLSGTGVVSFAKTTLWRRKLRSRNAGKREL